MTFAVDCLRSEHVVGNDRYPIFIGFMTPARLSTVAEAPQFRLSTPHQQVAANADSDPVLEWQRPIDDDRVKEIARIFSQDAEIMPNAVLLAAAHQSAVQLRSQGQGRLWTLKLTPSAPKPLWILDGQHRINGLTRAGSEAEIPFVLLASHDASASYQDSTFAKIFAQVTTTAEGLHPLHNEWLTYAFRLGKYDKTKPSTGAVNANHVDSMKAVIDLCTNRWLDAAKSEPNPFFDAVAFNPGQAKRTSAATPVGPRGGGFLSDATTMESFFFSSYYGSKSTPAGRLSPKQLAVEFGRAYEALVSCHDASSRSTSVLLTSAGTAGSTGHKAVQDGFIHGVLRFLANHGIPGDWEQELRDRAFDTTNWSASEWPTNRTGKIQTLNGRIAKATFEKLLGNDLSALFLPTVKPPTGLNLLDYFTGAIGAGIIVRGRRVGPRGTKLKVSGSDPMATIQSGTRLSRLALGPYRMVAAGETTANVQRLDVIDEARPHDDDWSQGNLRRGLLLERPDGSTPLLHKNPVRIEFTATFYGGEKQSFLLDVSYS